MNNTVVVTVTEKDPNAYAALVETVDEYIEVLTGRSTKMCRVKVEGYGIYDSLPKKVNWTGYGVSFKDKSKTIKVKGTLEKNENGFYITIDHI